SETLAGITFIQSPSKENVDDVRAVDNTVRSLLSGAYKSLDTSRLYDVFDGKHRVGVRAADPLVQPVMFGHNDPERGYLVQGAVSGAFSNVTSFLDTNGQQMARISYEVVAGNAKSSSWVPLSWLEFYPLEPAHPKELIRH